MIDRAEGGMMDLTSIVCSETSFDDLCELINLRARSVVSDSNERLSGSDLEVFKERRYIPLIRRGTHTEWIFDMFGARTNYMSIVVKGNGHRMMTDVLASKSSKTSLN